MYNLLNGIDDNALLVLRMLELEPKRFQRFRDAWIGNNELCVYTRLGGNNRATYADVFAGIERHPFYLRAIDDTVDSTFCTFYFAVPDRFREEIAVYVATHGPSPTGEERWARSVARLEGQVKREK